MLQGLLKVSTILVWPPTSIKDPITQKLIICFREKELFIHGKLIVVPSHCCASKSAQQSTKDAGGIWSCLKDWMPDSAGTGSPFQVNSDNLLLNRRTESLAQLIQE